ncbi:MAG TPA: ABC transporter substrate-binding protein [Burkholderiales bacterium]|jgi:branched-chain amino acid transport system substrate-binding protein
MTRSLRIALVLTLALSAGPAAAQARGEPVKLGLIDIYSGGFAFIADSIRNGFQIAVDEANAAGGLNGRQFALVTADMGGSVEKAVTEGRRMILEEKIKFITVGIHSGAAVAVGNLGKEHKVLVNGGFATTKRLTGENGHDYVARANLSTVEIGRVMAEHLRNRQDIKRVSVIAPDYEYGQHFAADFIAGLKAVRPDITIVRQEWPKLGATDYGPHVTALQAQPVDLVVGGMFGADLVNFLRSARDFGLFSGKTQFFTHGLDLAKMGALKDSLPPNTMGTVWYPFYAIDSAKSKAFAAEIQKRMGTYATGSTTVGYVAGKMLTEAIRKAGTAEDVEKVIKTLGTVQFEGPTGMTKVRACDNMALYNFYVGTVKLDASLPDGIGMGEVKAVNTESVARSCDEVKKARGSK